jgi:alkylation response protein AidB-like acyl-CoA dehydrogenase
MANMSAISVAFDDANTCSHQLVSATRTLISDLRTDAAAVERDGVDRARMDRLAAIGLHAITGPADYGGAPPAVYRRVSELLAGSDTTTWFVWYQHGVACRSVTSSTNEALRARRLGQLCAGLTQGSVAFSHLRRPGRSVVAERDGSGWRLSGRAPWCTGYGITDVVVLGAVTDERDERVLRVVVPLTLAPGISITPMELVAADGSRTVEIMLDGYRVNAEEVVELMPRQQWAYDDALATANVQPATFGITEAALTGLAEIDEDTAETILAGVLRCRAACYELADSPATDADFGDRVAVRAEALLRMVEATTALVAASGGAGVRSDNMAQRLARQALLLLVFAQSQTVRTATLAAITKAHGWARS